MPAAVGEAGVTGGAALLLALFATLPVRAAPTELCVGARCGEIEVPFALDDAERSFCELNEAQRLDCYAAYELDAAEIEQRLPASDGTQQRVWERAGLRRCEWSARLSLRWDPARARGFLERREARPCNPPDEHAQNTGNDELGLAVAEQARGRAAEGRSDHVANSCRERAAAGELYSMHARTRYERDVIQPKTGELRFADALRIMVVGDSISHGKVGDFTWRYRLHEHLREASVRFDFVGPYKGAHKGAYAVRGWDDDHAAQWGRAASQANDLIYEQVEGAWPDLLLIELGYNDLVWLKATPAQVRDELAKVVVRARECRPELDLLIAQIGSGEWLSEELAGSYDELLAELADADSRPESLIGLADVASSWDWTIDSRDGAHPNARGELVIARAFANALSEHFGIGARFTRELPPAVLPTIGPVILTPDTIGADQAFTASWPLIAGPDAPILYTLQIRYHRRYGYRVAAEISQQAGVSSITYQGPALSRSGIYEVIVIAIDQYGLKTVSEPVPLGVR